MILDAWLKFQKVLEQRFAVCCENRFWMELDSVDGKGFVAQPHDLALGCFSTDLETIRKGASFHEQ